jgi:hypothetical protein
MISIHRFSTVNGILQKIRVIAGQSLAKAIVV